MGRAILLADNSMTIQKAVEITFEKEDFEVVSVSSASEVLIRCKELNPAVALLDLNFDDPSDARSGYEICEELKQDPSCSDVQVILLYPSMGEFDEAKGQQVGAAAHLPKPFESQAMIDAVKGLASGAGAGAAVEAIAPEPIAPEPIAPEPIAPEPITPEPIIPEPITPEPPEVETIVPEPPTAEAVLEPLDEVDADLPEATLEPLPEDGDIPEIELEPVASEPEQTPPEAILSPEPLEAPPEAILTPEPLETPESIETPLEAMLTPEPLETPEPIEAPSDAILMPDPMETPEPIETPEPMGLDDEEDFTPDLDIHAPTDAMELEPVAPEPIEAPPASLAPEPVEIPEADGALELEPVAPETDGAPAAAAAPVIDRVVRDIAGARPAASGSQAEAQQALGALIYEVIERVAWEVVPDLAEAMIREELDKLIQAKKAGGG